MAISLEKPAKYSNWVELWGKVPVKLLVYVVELKDVYRINAKGIIKVLKNDLVLKVEVGSAKAKTDDIAPGPPFVNQFLFLCVHLKIRELTNVDPNASVEVTVKSGKHEVCEATLFKWNALPCDMVVEHEVDLKFPAKERTKNSPADIGTRVLGSIKLRVILTKGSGSQDPCPMWTSLSTTAPTGTAFTECQFFDTDKSLRKSVKTGDLIVFQDSGLPGHLMNLSTNSPYSRVGMVLRIPDKYTGRVRPFVVELTSNLQEFIDVSSELPRAGIVLFRLWERLHSVQGGSIWLLPLLEPIANDPLGNLIDFAQKTISQGSSTPESLTSVPSADILAFLQDLGIKDSLNYREVNSAAVCASLLRMGGKRPTEPQIVHSRATPKDPSGRDTYTPSPFMTPAALVGQTDLFGPLIPLRLMKSSSQA